MIKNFIDIRKSKEFMKTAWFVIIFLILGIKSFSQQVISKYSLEQNKNNSYNLKVFDEKNKIVYKEKFEKEPFIEIIDKHIIRVTISIGSPLNYTYFYDISSKKESPVYENALLGENNKIVIVKDKKLIVSDYMGKKIYLKKVIKNLADTAVPASAIISVKISNKNKIEIVYLNKEFEEITENFGLDYK